MQPSREYLLLSISSSQFSLNSYEKLANNLQQVTSVPVLHCMHTISIPLLYHLFIYFWKYVAEVKSNCIHALPANFHTEYVIGQPLLRTLVQFVNCIDNPKLGSER